MYAVPDTMTPPPPFFTSNGQMALQPPDPTTSTSLPFKPTGRGAAGSPPPLPPPPHPLSLYSSAGATVLQGFSGNSVYSLPVGVELHWNGDEDDVIEFSKADLRFVEKLGEGVHGEVR